MKAEIPNPLLHNPFHNRFNEPVSRRQDELQAEGYIVWLRERNLEHSGYKVPSVEPSMAKSLRGVLALLLVVVVSMVFLIKVM